jgi:hypothetical protein
MLAQEGEYLSVELVAEGDAIEAWRGIDSHPPVRTISGAPNGSPLGVPLEMADERG